MISILRALFVVAACAVVASNAGYLAGPIYGAYGGYAPLGYGGVGLYGGYGLGHLGYGLGYGVGYAPLGYGYGFYKK